MSGDYCELCDLPRSTCIHGMPAAPPKPAPAPRPKRAAKSAAGASSRASSRAASTKPAAPVRRAPRRWTPPEVLQPHIVDVLEEAGGELDGDDLFVRLEDRVADSLLEGDRETTPEGELRWRYAARRARQALIAEGVMARGRPGVWRLSD
jgi:hypothetical protein